MQLVELAPYSNGARFLRYTLLEFLSLSLTACHQPSFGGLNVCSFLYLHVQVQQQNYI
jgi:hypothetical protein